MLFSIVSFWWAASFGAGCGSFRDRLVSFGAVEFRGCLGFEGAGVFREFFFFIYRVFI